MLSKISTAPVFGQEVVLPEDLVAPVHAAAGDFDGDGADDMLLADASGRLRILPGGIGRITAADFSGHGRSDLAFASDRSLNKIDQD